MEDIQIIDMIDHRWERGTQCEIVVNRFPKPLFERRGALLIGHDSGFFQFYEYERPSANWKAFAGREFYIPMIDGTVEHANGQWWNTFANDFEGLVYSSMGVNTIESLEKCYVFFGSLHIDCRLIDEWRRNNEPSNNYYKYDPKDKTFKQHQIVSKWEPIPAA